MPHDMGFALKLGRFALKLGRFALKRHEYHILPAFER